MEISVTHVKQKDLPEYVFPDGCRSGSDLAQQPPVNPPPVAAKAAPASVAGVEAAAQEANANLAEAMEEGSTGQGGSKRRRVSTEAEQAPLDPNALDQGQEDEGAKHTAAARSSGETSGEKRRRSSQASKLVCECRIFHWNRITILRS